MMRIYVGHPRSLWQRLRSVFVDDAPWVLCSHCHYPTDRERTSAAASRNCTPYSICTGQYTGISGPQCNIATYRWG
jgi:hypothetical protein